jgi:predicted PurR-regulated permease PerM
MADNSAPSVDDSYLDKVTEAVVRVGLVLLLLVWCFNIIRPFITPVVWGVILAVAVFPVYRWLTASLAGRAKLAALILILIGFSVVLVPTILFAGSLIESGQQITEQQDLDSIHLPPPPAEVEDWPLIGASVYEFWSQASRNLEPLLVKFSPQLRDGAMWLVGATVGTGLAIAQSLLSIIIAGVMLVGASGGAQVASTLSKRLGGASGDKFIQMAIRTIRSVAVGIVGVAIIQGGLIGVGMLVAGVPHAGIWALLCLILAVLQLPPLLIVGPVVFYMFSYLSAPAAVAFAVWELAASLSDSFLKPILLARGVEVPMLVIFLGAIGGFMMSGFIGLFIGAVVLSLGYELATTWIEVESDKAEVARGAQP